MIDRKGRFCSRRWGRSEAPQARIRRLACYGARLRGARQRLSSPRPLPASLLHFPHNSLSRISLLSHLLSSLSSFSLSSTTSLLLFQDILSPQPTPYFSFETFFLLIHLLSSLSRYSLSSTVTIVLFGDFSLVYCPGEQKLLSLHIGHQKGAPRGAEIIPSNLMQLVLP